VTLRLTLAQLGVCMMNLPLFLFDGCNVAHRITANGLQLQEVGDFYHKCSYEALMFVEPQNFHTKHRTANFL